eukprot:gene24798-biopygen20920
MAGNQLTTWMFVDDIAGFSTEHIREHTWTGQMSAAWGFVRAGIKNSDALHALPRSPGELPRSPGDLPRSPVDLPRSPGDLPRSPGDLPRRAFD